MDRVPAAYIRRSFVDPESPGDIAEAAQLSEVRRLAAADGHNGNLVVYSDWGVSADVAKSAKRLEYTRLLADMEAGRILAVYAFDADRLYRDPRDLIRLQDAAKRHGVTITTKGGRLPIGDGDDPAGEGFTFITAVFGRMELQKAKKRNRAAMQARRERGDALGQPGYGWRSARDESGRIIHVPDPDQPANVVVEAYREAGSIMGAAKLLQGRGVPAPKGGTRWGQSTVTRILEREAPEIFPRPSRTGGRRTPTSMMFAQLLACHCGATMTPNRVRNQYYCPWGHRLGSAVHGKITASEAAVREWIEAKVDTMQLPADTIETTERNAARRDAVNARLEKAREDWYTNQIDRKKWDAEKARHAADLDALDATTKVVVKLPDRDRLWTYQPGDINAILREIFVRVDLGPDMLPIGAQPRNPDLFP
jgi:DNA invertase Pin-like site-specific DNA recombinase